MGPFAPFALDINEISQSLFSSFSFSSTTIPKHLASPNPITSPKMSKNAVRANDLVKQRLPDLRVGPGKTENSALHRKVFAGTM